MHWILIVMAWVSGLVAVAAALFVLVAKCAMAQPHPIDRVELLRRQGREADAARVALDALMGFWYPTNEADRLRATRLSERDEPLLAAVDSWLDGRSPRWNQMISELRAATDSVRTQLENWTCDSRASREYLSRAVGQRIHLCTQLLDEMPERLTPRD